MLLQQEAQGVASASGFALYAYNYRPDVVDSEEPGLRDNGQGVQTARVHGIEMLTVIRVQGPANEFIEKALRKARETLKAYVERSRSWTFDSRH